MAIALKEPGPKRKAVGTSDSERTMFRIASCSSVEDAISRERSDRESYPGRSFLIHRTLLTAKPCKPRRGPRKTKLTLWGPLLVQRIPAYVGNAEPVFPHPQDMFIVDLIWEETRWAYDVGLELSIRRQDTPLTRCAVPWLVPFKPKSAGQINDQPSHPGSFGPMRNRPIEPLHEPPVVILGGEADAPFLLSLVVRIGDGISRYFGRMISRSSPL